MTTYGVPRGTDRRANPTEPPAVGSERDPSSPSPGQKKHARVLHVITDTNRRGAQVFAGDLAALLEDAGTATHHVVALTDGGFGAQLDLPTLGPSRLSAPTLRALRRHIAESDLVVAHGSTTLPACVVAGLGSTPPVIYRNISDPAYWLDRPSRRFRVKTMLRRATRVVALWPGGASYLRGTLGLPGDRIVVIPNGVPVADFSPPTAEQRAAARRRFDLPPDGTVLVFPAALRREKHPDTAVRALAHLPPDVTLMLVGDGSMHAEVERLAAEIAPGRVVLAGQIADPVNAYWAADAVVLPSEGEGLPAVLIEASLCGTPSVASTSGGNASIVLDGATGVVVPPADEHALAAGVRTVLEDRDRLGAAARAHCLETFAMHTVAAQWGGVIDEVLR